MTLKSQIENYTPFNEQEEKDKQLFLKYINHFDDVLTRNNELAHFSASAFVLNEDKSKMLVVYHNIFDGWIYPGGHADGESNLLNVAIREVEEETGLKTKVLDKNIFSLQALPINGHIKHGEYVSSHIHLDIVYLLEAKDTDPLFYRKDESKGVKWISLDKATDDNIVDFIKPIHQKLRLKHKRKNR